MLHEAGTAIPRRRRDQHAANAAPARRLSRRAHFTRLVGGDRDARLTEHVFASSKRGEHDLAMCGRWRADKDCVDVTRLDNRSPVRLDATDTELLGYGFAGFPRAVGHRRHVYASDFDKVRQHAILGKRARTDKAETH